MRVEHIGDAVLYLGDCLEILPTLGKVDAVVTDPPYGIGLGTHKALRDNRPHLLRKAAYESYIDSPENFAAVVVPAIGGALAIADRGAVFCAGSMLRLLPEPSALGGVYTPAGIGRNRWGFTCFHAIALYGYCPTLRHGATKTVLQSSEAAEASDHPVPKPLGWMKWIIGLSSVAGHTILDPFMGSGTTGVACAKLGRKFIGIEIEPKYFDIACRRIDEAYKQPRLFAEPTVKAVQEKML